MELKNSDSRLRVASDPGIWRAKPRQTCRDRRRQTVLSPALRVTLSPLLPSLCHPPTHKWSMLISSQVNLLQLFWVFYQLKKVDSLLARKEVQDLTTEALKAWFSSSMKLLWHYSLTVQRRLVRMKRKQQERHNSLMCGQLCVFVGVRASAEEGQTNNMLQMHHFT